MRVDRAKELVPDLLASIVVLLVALPLSIGIAVACGVPPERGLITAIIGGIVVGSVSGSPLLVSGPAASLIVPVFTVVESHGMATLAPVVVLAGVWQLIAGRLRLGSWFRAVAPAVIHGMLIGIGILIVASQLHVMIDSDARGSFLSNVTTFPGALMERLRGGGDASMAGAIVGVSTIVLLVAWNRLRPQRLRLIPGHLVSLLVVVGPVLLLGAPVRFLDVSKQFFAGLQVMEPGQFGGTGVPYLIGTSLMFAFVASAATLLTAVAIDRRQSHARTDYNREMMAQGLGNTLTGLLGGLPMTGVIVRSSTNVDAGARTRWSTVLHGTWILLFVTVAPEVLEAIPRACLGAILVYTGWRLIDYSVLRTLYERGRAELAISLLTLFGVVFIELFVGILMGLAAALAKIIYTFSHLEIRHEPGDDEHHLTLSGSATFLRLPALAETLEAIPGNRPLHLHVGQLEHIDHACLELFANWEQQRQARGEEGLVADWSLLSSRYHRTFLGLPDDSGRADASAGTVLSLMWSEWKRVYGPERNGQLGADWIVPARVHLRLEARELDPILGRAAELLAPAAGVPSAAIADALRARSSEGQVSLGSGVSIPHASIEGLERPLAALITTRAPIEVAGESVDLFFVLLAPDTEPRLHLLSLAHVGRICHSEKLLGALRSAAGPGQAARLLQQTGGRYEGPAAPRGDARLLAVLEIPGDEQVEGIRELIEQGLTHAVVLSDRDGAIFETVRSALHVPRSRRLALLTIDEHDKNVLAGLIAEFSRLSSFDEDVQIHVLAAEPVSLPSSPGA